ncbi:hypothetical protein GCM10007984_06870 [Shewanella putrefaciens]|nr:hypothetical protein GCM10007984_06870 [Shewanella putrefaciens]
MDGGSVNNEGTFIDRHRGKFFAKRINTKALAVYARAFVFIWALGDDSTMLLSPSKFLLVNCPSDGIVSSLLRPPWMEEVSLDVRNIFDLMY